MDVAEVSSYVPPQVTTPKPVDAPAAVEAAPQPAPQPVPAEKGEEHVPQPSLEKVVTQLNKSIEHFSRHLDINIHEKTRRVMVKVMDTDTNEVIREIPPEKVLDAFARTLELAGILVDKKS